MRTLQDQEVDRFLALGPPYVGRASVDRSPGGKLKAAIQARLALRSRHKVAASSDVDDDSFGAKLKRAIAARLPTQKQHREQAEKNASRYHFHRRPCTKSD